MDKKSLMTAVSVHSPMIQFAPCGTYYTTYAVSLKSDNPCFTYSSSQTRRRYSEFLHLRRSLSSHYPTIKPPQLPPKRFFNRFGDSQIEERRQGLQKFLEDVLAVSVYLSDKSLHLFLQTSCTMSQIDEQCLGDIPIPQLMDNHPSLSASCPFISINSSLPSTWVTSPISLGKRQPFDDSSTDSANSSVLEDDLVSALPISKLRVSNTNSLTIPKRIGSLDSSPCSSLSSVDGGYCGSVDCHKPRRVSFSDHVTVAVVYNNLWNFMTEPMSTSA